MQMDMCMLLYHAKDLYSLPTWSLSEAVKVASERPTGTSSGSVRLTSSVESCGALSLSSRSLISTHAESTCLLLSQLESPWRGVSKNRYGLKTQ